VLGVPPEEECEHRTFVVERREREGLMFPAGGGF
jgi:hypothetical protein